MDQRFDEINDNSITAEGICAMERTFGKKNVTYNPKSVTFKDLQDIVR